MKIELIILSTLLLSIFSCKKESTILPCESLTVESYIPMSVGSYWVYQWYEVDSSGTEKLLQGKTDKVTIEKDTLIEGFFYKKIKEENSFIFAPNVTQFRRDSLGFLVDPENNIYFSSSNLTDTLRTFNGSNFKVIYKMEISPNGVETPLGIFDCLNFQGEYTPFLSVDWDKEYVNTFYSRGIGKIQENSFYFSSAHITQFQRRLIEYHLE